MNNLKRTFARILLPFLTIWLCFLPSQSYAFAPALIPLAGVFLETNAAAAGVASSIAIAEAATGTAAGVLAGAGSAVVIDAVASGLVTTIGAVVSFIAFNSATGDKVRIPLTSDPAISDIPAPIAAPTVSPTGGSVNTDVAFTSNYVCASYLGGCSGMTGITQSKDYWENKCLTFISSKLYTEVFVPAANGFYSCNLTTVSTGVTSTSFSVQPVPSTNCPANSTLSGSSCVCNSGFGSDPSGTFCAPVVAQTCAPGYSLLVDSCVLENSRLVTLDQALDYGRPSVSTMTPPDPAEADIAQPLKGVVSPDAQTVEVAGVDSAGQPIRYHVSARPDGGSVVEQKVTTADAADQTVTDTTVLNISPQGVVETVHRYQTNDAPTVQPGTTPGDTTITYAPPSGQTSTQTQTTASTVTFPGDYARQGEAAAAANLIKPSLDLLHNDLSATTDVPDPVDPGEMLDYWGSTFTNLLSWQLPAHSSQCPTPTFDLSNMGLGVFTMDSHCTLMNNNAQGLHSAMVTAFTIIALFTVLRA